MIWENVNLAFSSLRSNKMRALLTMLGIIIGIMSIIAIVIIGDAMTSSVSDSLSSLGVTNINISVQERGQENQMMMLGGPNGGGSSRASISGKSPATEDLISTEMIEDMEQSFGDQISGVSLSYSGGSAEARDGELYANVSITGVNADYFLANEITFLSGRLISDADTDERSQTAIVSDKLVSNMFGDDADPIGETVKIYKSDRIEVFTIIGVYEYEETGFGGVAASDQDISTTFYIPVTTAKLDILEKNYNNMTVIGADKDTVTDLTTNLQSYFDRLYIDNEDWKMNVSNMSSMLETVTDTLGTISMAIAFIAGISLLVGGIGVMNIMLVSVTERTREIGTRKALGAKNFHIQFQFVTEAIIISAVGGVIGLALGIGAGAVLSSVMAVPLVVSPFVTIGSVLFSMAIGVFFGLYPARKASRLDPIEALRYE